jgi:hypothetical protein
VFEIQAAEVRALPPVQHHFTCLEGDAVNLLQGLKEAALGDGETLLHTGHAGAAHTVNRDAAGKIPVASRVAGEDFRRILSNMHIAFDSPRPEANSSMSTISSSTAGQDYNASFRTLLVEVMARPWAFPPPIERVHTMAAKTGYRCAWPVFIGFKIADKSLQRKSQSLFLLF